MTVHNKQGVGAHQDSFPIDNNGFNGSFEQTVDKLVEQGSAKANLTRADKQELKQAVVEGVANKQTGRLARLKPGLKKAARGILNMVQYSVAVYKAIKAPEDAIDLAAKAGLAALGDPAGDDAHLIEAEPSATICLNLNDLMEDETHTGTVMMTGAFDRDNSTMTKSFELGLVEAAQSSAGISDSQRFLITGIPVQALYEALDSANADIFSGTGVTQEQAVEAAGALVDADQGVYSNATDVVAKGLEQGSEKVLGAAATLTRFFVSQLEAQDPAKSIEINLSAPTSEQVFKVSSPATQPNGRSSHRDSRVRQTFDPARLGLDVDLEPVARPSAPFAANAWEIKTKPQPQTVDPFLLASAHRQAKSERGDFPKPAISLFTYSGPQGDADATLTKLTARLERNALAKSSARPTTTPLTQRYPELSKSLIRERMSDCADMLVQFTTDIGTLFDSLSDHGVIEDLRENGLSKSEAKAALGFVKPELETVKAQLSVQGSDGRMFRERYDGYTIQDVFERGAHSEAQRRFISDLITNLQTLHVKAAIAISKASPKAAQSISANAKPARLTGNYVRPNLSKGALVANFTAPPIRVGEEITLMLNGETVYSIENPSDPNDKRSVYKYGPFGIQGDMSVGQASGVLKEVDTSSIASSGDFALVEDSSMSIIYGEEMKTQLAQARYITTKSSQLKEQIRQNQQLASNPISNLAFPDDLQGALDELLIAHYGLDEEQRNEVTFMDLVDMVGDSENLHPGLLNLTEMILDNVGDSVTLRTPLVRTDFGYEEVLAKFTPPLENIEGGFFRREDIYAKGSAKDAAALQDSVSKIIGAIEEANRENSLTSLLTKIPISKIQGFIDSLDISIASKTELEEKFSELGVELEEHEESIPMNYARMQIDSFPVSAILANTYSPARSYEICTIVRSVVDILEKASNKALY